MNNKPRKPNGKKSWLSSFADWISNFLIAVAEARIPPSKMAVVPRQGTVNLVTGLLGIVLYTAAGQINAAGRSLQLASQFTMAGIGAVLLFLAAVIVIFTARGKNIVDDWKKTTSLFIVVWLLALIVFLILTYPLLLVSDIIILDRLAYWLEDVFFRERFAWRADLIKSFICTFLAGLILIYRTKISDRKFSLKSIAPWAWLALMTIVVGIIFDISLYRLSQS